MHVALAFGARLVGAHCKEVIAAAAMSDRFAVCDDPFKEAVIVAV